MSDELVDTGSQNVTGYRKRTPEALALVNQVKEMERNFASWLDQVYFGEAKGNLIELDPRQVAMMRTASEEVFYRLTKAVFRPEDPIGDVVRDGLSRG
jgi:hypothetical protein